MWVLPLSHNTLISCFILVFRNIIYGSKLYDYSDNGQYFDQNVSVVL